MEKLRAVDLHEAIGQIEKQRIRRDEIVILAPLGTMAGLVHSELERDGMAHILYQSAPHKPSRFSGVLVIEDVMHTEVVVKSLVGAYRVVCPTPSQADRICGMLDQIEKRED